MRKLMRHYLIPMAAVLSCLGPLAPQAAAQQLKEVGGWRVGTATPKADFCMMQRVFPDRVAALVAFAGDDVMGIYQRPGTPAVPAGKHKGTVTIDESKVADVQAENSEGILATYMVLGYRGMTSLQNGKMLVVKAADKAEGFALEGVNLALPALVECALGLKVEPVTTAAMAMSVLGVGPQSRTKFQFLP